MRQKIEVLLKLLVHVERYWRTPIPGESTDSEFGVFAERALRELSAWFGPPIDPDVPYEIVKYDRSVCSYDFISKRYSLFIRERDQKEPMLGSIVHEMYHRVTSARKKQGLHRFVWVDEVLACHASRKLLVQLGHRAYAETVLRQMMRAPKRASLQELVAVRSWLPIAVLRRYPLYFRETVTIIGESMEQAVGWDKMCAMVHHASWYDWLTLLSPEERNRFHAMLGDVMST